MSDERILIVQEDGPEAVHLEACLADLGYAVAAVSCGRRALDRARTERPDLALVDLALEGEISGPETALGLGGALDLPVVYLTGDASGERVRRSRRSTTSPTPGGSRRRGPASGPASRPPSSRWR